MYPLIKNTLIKDLIEETPNLFRDKVTYRPIHSTSTVAKKSNKIMLYPLSHLPTMLIGDDKRIVQYIIAPNKRMLLARGDLPGRGHAQMSNAEVLAAGYLFLNDDREIIGISNESPEFEQQSLLSLLWPTLAIQVRRSRIADQFSIIDSNSQSEYSLHSTDRIAITLALLKSQRAAIAEANASNVVLSSENGQVSQSPTFFTGLKPSTDDSLNRARHLIAPPA